MDPAASATLTAESFSMVALFMRADWVIKAVMIGLALASLFSWAVIIDKLLRFAALNRHADRFEDQVSSGRSLEEIANEAGDRPRHALPRMLQAALREWREARTKGLASDSQAGFLIQRIDRMGESEGYFVESLASALTQASDDAKEGMQAFLEKREIRFDN